MKLNLEIIWKDRKHILWFPFSFTKYELTEERLLVTNGLLNTSYNETYLYRLIDCKCSRSLLQKICNTGTVTLIGMDATHTILELQNIKNPLIVKEMLSKLILKNRKENKVLEISGGQLDLSDENGDGFPDFIS